MAEGLGRKYLGDRFQIESAGIEAHGLNPDAVRVMQEIGIDIGNHRSKTIDDGLLFSAHAIVTLCGDARDKCPVTPPSIPRWHWDLVDPARAQGTQEERLEVFRRVRDQIEQHVKELGTILESTKH